MSDTARVEAARRWFGYGRWTAPYWFVGMEPGGNDDHASYDSWLGLGGQALIDCCEHHEDSNRRANRAVTRWHHPAPPIQTTWGPLIQVALAFEARPSEEADVGAFQRDEWGRTSGNTAVIEISALHARNLNVDVERTLHRSERIAEIKRQLAANQPRFALFYGTTRVYRKAYEAIAGRFNAQGWCWSGKTLCVLTQHPAYRYAPPAAYWRALGTWLQAAVAAGPNSMPNDAIPRAAAAPPRSPSPSPSKPTPPAAPTPRRLPVAANSTTFDAFDPKHTLEIIEHLVERHGFEQRHFAQLHHFGARASLRQHLVHCRDLKNHFTSQTNATVAERLHRALGYLDAGEHMTLALQRVIVELPMRH